MLNLFKYTKPKKTLKKHDSSILERSQEKKKIRLHQCKGMLNKNIIMSSFKSSGDIQKKEGGPDSCFG